MVLIVNEDDVAILEALVASVIDSNIGIDCLVGYPSVKQMSADDIQEKLNDLSNKISGIEK